jgi:queuine tRNA-ribosyltransferase
VQGGIYKDLRAESVRVITSMTASGYAIGGVSVGESREDIDEIVKFTAPLLPEGKPRYLMGIGTHEDVIKAIEAGIDMFDCVMPTRIARHGCFFDTDGARQLIKAERYREDFGPLAEGCSCYTCTNHSRAYIRHLWRSSESVAGTLLSIHNLQYLIKLSKNHSVKQNA